MLARTRACQITPGRTRAAASALGMLGLLALAPVGGANSGGQGYVPRPAVQKVACVSPCPEGTGRAYYGSTIRITGARLSSVTRVIFHGRSGKTDDRVVRVKPASDRSVKVRVPGQASSGPVSAGAGSDGSIRSERSKPLGILPPPPAPSAAPSDPTPGSPAPSGDDHVFPIQGAHDYGGAGARFGTGRAGHSHQGQDVFAKCGTKLVAAKGGVVQFRQYHSAAGHYVVIDGAGSSLDYVYMHLTSASPFKEGDKVVTGQQIGTVGDSGNASGCHLHFELWASPGWYDGGKPVDPYPYLKSWDR